MSIIGEAILTASVDLLVNKLASEGILFFARQEQIEADLMRWANMLEMIKAVLDDAEEKKSTNQFVNKWLGKLQNLAYDVEDLLDEFQTEAFRRRLLLGNGEPAAAHDQPSSSRIRTNVEMSVDGREVREVREVQRGWRTILGLVNPYTLCSNSPTNEWVEVVD